MKYLIGSIFGLAMGCGLLCSSCTKQEQVQTIAAITSGGACIADIALAVSGVEDPVAIAANCSALVSDVYQVVSELLASEPVSSTSDAGTSMAMSVSSRARLVRIQARALALMSDAGTP